jgi:hypothetical protein
MPHTSDPEHTYGLWHPKVDGQRNGREAGLELATATTEQLEKLSAKVAAGKVEAQQMLGEGQHICERSIGAYHAAFYAELEAWVTKARGAI